MQKKDQVFLYIKDEIEKISSAEEKEILEDTESLIENTDIIEKKPKTKKFIYFFVIPLLVLVILVAILSTISSKLPVFSTL